MKSLKIATLLGLFITMMIACQRNDDNTMVDNTNDCVFVQNDDNMDGLIDDTEKMIMDECMENSLSSKSAIESNLIGEWELIGHGEGWLPTKSKPCGYITVSENELTFEFTNAFTDTITTHQWEVEEVDWSGGQYFRLKVTPGNAEGLFINQFCENYMYGDATPSDGNMYLYTKVE